MRIVFLWILILFSEMIKGQQLPNSDFENWAENNEGALLYPVNWIELVSFTFCSPNPNFVVPGLDSNNGNYAALLESTSCTLEGGVDVVVVAKMGTGGGGNSPLDFSRPYSSRPDTMQFYYKFEPEGSDTATIKFMLFQYDSIENEVTDTIALVKGWIANEVTDYQVFKLPISYLNDLTPNFISIVFTNSKTVTDNFLGYTLPGVYASVGTKFWIDDIQMIGGDVAVEEETETSAVELMFTGYAIRIMTTTGLPLTIELYSSDGKLIYSRAKQTICEIENLPKGLYVIKVTDDSGKLVATRKFGI